MSVDAGFVRECRERPDLFCRVALGFKPWQFQRSVLDSVRDNRETAVRSCHDIGKTRLAGAVVLWWVTCYPGSVAITTATTLRQVRDLLWKEIRALHRDSRINLGPPPGVLRWEIRPDWFAEGFTAPANDETRYQGFHAESGRVLGVIDEAAGVPAAAFTGFSAVLSQQAAKLLYIGNATWGGGEFGRKNKILPRRSVHACSAFDTPNFTTFGITLEDIRSGEWREKVREPLPAPFLVSPEWVAERHADWGESDPRWWGRVLGEFPRDDDNALVPLSWVEAAQDRFPEVEASEREREAWQGKRERDRPLGWGTKVRIGTDVARGGEDSTWHAFAHERGISALVRGRGGRDTMATAGEVMVYVREQRTKDRTPTNVNIDADGVGAGVYDRLAEEQRTDVRGPLSGVVLGEVRGGQTAHQPRDFVNRRSELLWALREAMNPANPKAIAIPPLPALVTQATSLRWRLDSKGRVAVETKDEYKARTKQGSPDELDACAYALADDVQPREDIEDADATFRTMSIVSGLRGLRR